MLLNDRQIKERFMAHVAATGDFIVEPYEESFVQPASLDIRLDSKFGVFNNHAYDCIDPRVEQPNLVKEIEIPPDDYFVLHPGEMVLASTYEFFRIPGDLAVRVEGKSSLGRLGLHTHATAGWVDPGFEGYVTLELSNQTNLPIRLYPGMKIGQVCFFQMDGECENLYGSETLGSRYQHQRGPTPSKSWKNFHQTDVRTGSGAFQTHSTLDTAYGPIQMERIKVDRYGS